MNKSLIKYCGNRSFEDWNLVLDSRADYIGLIFAESNRRVTEKEVKKWIEYKPIPKGKHLVGIFVNPSLSYIQQVIKLIPLDIIQCHGYESRDFIKSIKANTGLPVWKAVHHNENALLEMKNLKGVVDGFIIDTKSKDAWGGTGIAFDWRVIPLYQNIAKEQGVPCFIAGGVNPTNVQKLLFYHVDGIDISSGIETENQKCSEKIRRIESEVENFVHNLS